MKQSKPGYLTTEFWSHLILSIFGVLAGLHVVPNGLPQRYSMVVQAAAFLVAGIATGLYALSRGKVKTSSSFHDLAIGAIDQLRSIDESKAETYIEGLLSELGVKLPDRAASARLRDLLKLPDPAGQPRQAPPVQPVEYSPTPKPI